MRLRILTAIGVSMCLAGFFADRRHHPTASAVLYAVATPINLVSIVLNVRAIRRSFGVRAIRRSFGVRSKGQLDDRSAALAEFPAERFHHFPVSGDDEAREIVAQLAIRRATPVYAQARWFGPKDGLLFVEKRDKILMYLVHAHIIGRKKATRFRCRSDWETKTLVRDILANGFEELDGPDGHANVRTYWPAHRILKVTVSLSTEEEI